MLQASSDALLRRNAIVVERAAAAALRPDPRLKLSEWAQNYRKISAESSVLPGDWSNDVAPEMVEIMDRLSPEDPCQGVVLMKCAQSGGSEIAVNWLGFIAHKVQGPAMYIGPTIKASKDWKIEKLDPTIAETPVLNPTRGGCVLPQRSRSGEGSTGDRLRFKGGYVLFAGANSAASLRQHSIRFMIRDDRSAWETDAEGEGDPKWLSDQRLKTYRRFGLSKTLDISTPVDKGEDIDREYEAGDKRRFYVACKSDSCGAIADLVWEDIRREKTAPYRCRWYCPNCNTEHTDQDKAVMKSLARGACWIPTVPDENGEVPPRVIAREDIPRWRDRITSHAIHSYHEPGEITSFESWDELARQESEAGDDPELQKPFINSGLGRPWESRGEGPAWEALSARREPGLRRGIAPIGPLYFTLSVDVQGDGLYWAREGFGPRKECWIVDYGYLSGATDAPREGAWRKLDAIVEQGFRLHTGARVADDAIAVDSGYNAEAVYEWVRHHANAIAVKGEEGWSKPAIYGARTAEVKRSGASAGKARKYGLKVWLIGTYGIKAALMIYLGRTPDKGVVPSGYHHFPADAEEEFFRHLSSEYVKTEMGENGPHRIWARRGPNHWLDCHVYNTALTHHAGLWNWSEAKWEARAAELASASLDPARDLFSSVQDAIAPPVVIEETDADPTEPELETTARRIEAPPRPMPPRQQPVVADHPYLD